MTECSEVCIASVRSRQVIAGHLQRTRSGLCDVMAANSGQIGAPLPIVPFHIFWHCSRGRTILEGTRISLIRTELQGTVQRSSEHPTFRKRRSRQRSPLSPPTRCRSTPIATTGLPFSLRLDTEGTMSARLLAWTRRAAEGNEQDRPLRAPSNMANLYVPTHGLWSCLGSHRGVE